MTNTNDVSKQKQDIQFNSIGITWRFAPTHPVITYLLLTFAWSWLIWFAAIPFATQNKFLLYALTLVGGFGPAIGGIITLGLKKGLRIDLNLKKIIAWILTSAFIFGLMDIRYSLGNIEGFETLPGDLQLTPAVVISALVTCLIGGWMISNARSSNFEIRAKMGSLLPKFTKFRFSILALSVYPLLILISWAGASLLGLDIEYPGLWGQSATTVLPLFLLSFSLTALARGGNEEPGWRGVMQPELQKKVSPLAASLIIAFFWSLWHLPLFLNGFYSGPVVAGMIGGGIFRVFLSIFLTWAYNRSDGNVLLMVLLHASFNVIVDYLPLSDVLLAILWLLVSIIVVVSDKMYKRHPDKQLNPISY